MESSTLKVENLKPVILKAGVPLAVSLAGLIYAWIMSKKSFSSKVSSFSEIEPYSDTPEESFHNNLSSLEDEEEEPATPTYSISSVLSRSLVIHDNNNNNPCLEKEITILRSQIEGLQMRELALNLQFHHYCEMKEQESMLVEIKNMLSLETARVEFLDREISLIETETMRMENFTVQYLRILEQLVYMRSENKVLQKKVQKLLRKSKAQSLLIKEQTLKIKEGEEVQRSHDALQKRDSVINELKGEIKELQRVLVQFQEEKNELVKKLDHTAEEQAQLHRKPLKYYLQVEVESDDVIKKEDYNKILNELEHVKKERAIEFEELIQLRRINGCLRQELMRHQDHNIEVGFEGSSGGVMMQYDSEHELHCYSLEHGNVSTSCIGSSSSKRRRLLRRLKKWVEGSEKGRRVKPEVGVGGDSVSYGSEKPEVPVTPRICSSA